MPAGSTLAAPTAPTPAIEATIELRKRYPTTKLPIIALTSFALSGDDRKAKDAGATAYLTKPYSPLALLALIRKLLPEE